jgi:hypothetical protein
MGIRASILAGLATSAVFYLLQKYALEIAFPWDVAVATAVFFATLGLAMVMNKPDAAPEKSSTTIMSGIDGKKGVSATIDGLTTDQSPKKVMTGIKAEGDVELEIKNSKFNEKGK